MAVTVSLAVRTLLPLDPAVEVDVRFFGLEDFIGAAADQGKSVSGGHGEQFQSGAPVKGKSVR